jgi:ABC-type uncharacterized transport system permease subunit
MSAGKGWIALVVIFLGARKPQGVLAAAFVFAAAESFSNHAQGFWNLPAGCILAFPYLCTLIALILVSVFPTCINRKKHVILTHEQKKLGTDKENNRQSFS